MNLKSLPLINIYPTLTPMEETQSNLEVTVTMMMLHSEIIQSEKQTVADSLMIASAALKSAAEA